MKICIDTDKFDCDKFTVVINHDQDGLEWIDIWQVREVIWSNSTANNPPLPQGITITEESD